jgi:hypothetical protein
LRPADAKRLNPEVIEFGENRYHCGVWVAEEDAATDADKDPTKTFEHGLAFEVAVQLLRSVPALTIALDGEPSSAAFGHEVNAVGAYRPLRLDTIPGIDQASHDHLLEWRIRAGPPLFNCAK